MCVPVAIYRQRKHKPPDTDVDTMDNIGSYTDIRSFEKCKCISICVTIPDKGQIKGGMSMKCKFCGNDLPEESKFCPSCGAPVEPEEKQEQSEQSAEAKQQENQNPYEYGTPGTDNGSGHRMRIHISMEVQNRITRTRTSMEVKDRITRARTNMEVQNRITRTHTSMEAQDRITRTRTSMEVQDRTRLQIIMLIMGLMVSRRSRSMERPI